MQVPNVNIVPAQQSQGRVAKRAGRDFLIFHCLVVSVDVERQEMLARAAAENDWETVVCSDAASALTVLGQMFLQLAIIDLERDASGQLHELLGKLPTEKGLLTVVCGNEGNMEEEIFVRQSGAWLYLPGVNDTSNVSLLCGEARHIVERLHAAASAAADRKPTLRRAR